MSGGDAGGCSRSGSWNPFRPLDPQHPGACELTLVKGVDYITVLLRPKATPTCLLRGPGQVSSHPQTPNLHGSQRSLVTSRTRPILGCAWSQLQEATAHSPGYRPSIFLGLLVLDKILELWDPLFTPLKDVLTRLAQRGVVKIKGLPCGPHFPLIPHPPPQGAGQPRVVRGKLCSNKRTTCPFSGPEIWSHHPHQSSSQTLGNYTCPKQTKETARSVSAPPSFAKMGDNAPKAAGEVANWLSCPSIPGGATIIPGKNNHL